MESLDYSLPYLAQYSYAGLIFLILLFSFVIPLSKTLVIVAAGMLAAQGTGSLMVYLLVACLAMVVADTGYYLLGHQGGYRVLQLPWFQRRGQQRYLQAAHTRFAQHDALAVFSARFLPFVRSFIFLIAGLNRMSVWRFLLADCLSALIYVPLALLLGYTLYRQRALLLNYVEQGEYLLALLVLGLLLVWVWYRRKD